jgi:hypothetical protein
MPMNRFFLVMALCAALAAPARACLSGWDCCKWDDQKHQTPKYVVGRVISAFPHTPAGLKQALPIINAIYPGTAILPGKGDKVHIPCVGVVDLIVAAGEGGKAWWWGADAAGNECNKCKPNRCEDVSKSTKCGGNEGPGAGPGAGTGAGIGEAGSGYGGAAGNCGGVKVPNRLSVVQQTAADNPDAWSAKLNPNEMEECRPDSRYIDLVVDNLRREDQRWGFNCKRGNCNDPSHDVIAYYFGQGKPYEGAPQVMLVDMIQNSCAPNAQPSWQVLEANFGNGSGAGWTSKGRFAAGPHQNIIMNCLQKGEAPTASVSPLGGGGYSPSPSPSSAPKAAAKNNDGGPGGAGRNSKAPPLEGPGASEEPPAPAPAPAEAEEEPQ